MEDLRWSALDSDRPNRAFEALDRRHVCDCDQKSRCSNSSLFFTDAEESGAACATRD